jgi:Zn-dependent protease with chaperone function
MTDLERQSVSDVKSPLQYGTVPSKAQSETKEKLPLLLGIWSVQPETLYRIGLYVYVAWFVIHRIADIAYICTIDARFPAGLGHLYPSEAQRLESVSYTRQVLLCGMLHRSLVFVVIFTLTFFQLFAKFDTALREFFASIPTWWETSFIRRGCTCCCSPMWQCLRFCFSPVQRCLSYVFARPCAWCVQLKDRIVNGRLTTDISDRFGFRYSFRELLHGSVYLSIFGACFFLLSAPFMYWMQDIDLKFGFANSLTVSLANFKTQVFVGVISMLIWGVPKKFVFLAVLQYRLGWLFMWGGLTMSILFAQYNVQHIAPMLGMDNKFPSQAFTVGRGFPLAQTQYKFAPWISLNRLFFKDPSSPGYLAMDAPQFSTHDKSQGPLQLFKKQSGKWVISDNVLVNPAAAIYAQTKNPAAGDLVDSLAEQSWTVGGPETRMGVRSGKELRDKLFDFARESHIGIGQIYMVDGSHKDARANAFVTGAGNHSIIGLYDTLFLGQRGKEAAEDDDSEEDDIHELTTGGSLLQRATEVVQDVDVNDEDRRKPRNSAQTQAMSDDEIVSILAHELAHSALKHMEQGMSFQAVSSFATFAALGWMASSPLAAAALSLSAPALHVGACAYDHVVGPPFEGFLKLFSDALTRHNEYEADAYAARISEKYANALQTSLAKLSVNSNQDPDIPLFYDALHADHPTFARRWEHIENVKKEYYPKKP